MLELSIEDPDRLVAVTHALSTRSRVEMLRLLDKEDLNIIEIAARLQLPVSTVASNVKVLEAAGLIRTSAVPASRGAMKLCSSNYSNIQINLNEQRGPELKKIYVYEVDMPVGHYSDCEVEPTCGMASAEGLLLRKTNRRASIIPSILTPGLSGFAAGILNICCRWICLNRPRLHRLSCRWRCVRKHPDMNRTGPRILLCG